MNGIIDKLTEMYQNVAGMLNIDQALMIAAALLVLVIVLLIVISSMGRRHEEALEELSASKPSDSDALKKKLAEAAEELKRKDQRIVELNAELAEVKRLEAVRAAEVIPAACEMADAGETVANAPVEPESPVRMDAVTLPAEKTTALIDRLVSVEGANEEANRILSDARARAYAVMLQAEQLYEEASSRANENADFIRAKANEYMAHAHDTLKHARVRANEIVSEAEREAGRLRQPSFVTLSDRQETDA